MEEVGVRANKGFLSEMVGIKILIPSGWINYSILHPWSATFKQI